MRELAERILLERRPSLFFTGQAGFICKNSDGRLLGVDLCLSDSVERVEEHMGFKRLLPKLIQPEDIELDILIATHAHADHFDRDAVPWLMAGQETRLYASVQCAAETKKLLISEERCRYVTPGDSIADSGFHIEFVDCDHGEAAPDAVGVIVEFDGKTIYMAGDTCLRMDRVPALTEGRKLDVVIGPINGAFGNMNEKEFATYAHALHGRVTIPCHYGMFASHGGNPGKFYEIMRTQYPKDNVLLMAQGEKLIL